MESPILNFFLLVLRILLDLGSNADHKDGKFFKTFLQKSFEFVSSRRAGIIAFNLSFVLLQVEVNPIPNKQSC